MLHSKEAGIRTCLYGSMFLATGCDQLEGLVAVARTAAGAAVSETITDTIGDIVGTSIGDNLGGVLPGSGGGA